MKFKIEFRAEESRIYDVPSQLASCDLLKSEEIDGSTVTELSDQYSDKCNNQNAVRVATRVAGHILVRVTTGQSKQKVQRTVQRLTTSQKTQKNSWMRKLTERKVADHRPTKIP
jgi:hypothetical protein